MTKQRGNLHWIKDHYYFDYRESLKDQYDFISQSGLLPGHEVSNIMSAICMIQDDVERANRVPFFRSLASIWLRLKIKIKANRYRKLHYDECGFGISVFHEVRNDIRYKMKRQVQIDFVLVTCLTIFAVSILNS